VRAELPSIYIRLLNALASYLAQPVKRHGASSTPDPQDLAAVVVHGDILRPLPDWSRSRRPPASNRNTL
jgi:hypothetical protein